MVERSTQYSIHTFNPEATAVIWMDVEIIVSCGAVGVMFILPPVEHLHNLCH